MLPSSRMYTRLAGRPARQPWSLALPVFLAVLASLAVPASAQLFFESAQTAITGPWASASGVLSNATYFSGAEFFVSSPVHVTAIGGHFTDSSVTGNNEIFGAIVPVPGLGTPPNPTDLSANVLGTTLITLPAPLTSQNVSGALSLVLQPGWYAELFGAGKFGATGDGFAITSSDGSPANVNGVLTYTVRQTDGMFIDQAAGARYFVLGVQAVPEPSPALALLLGCAGAGCLLRLRRAQGCR